MKRLRDHSIRIKLHVLVAAAAGSALVLACTVFVVNDVASARASLVQHLSAIADVLGANCTAALAFNDPKVAQEALSSLRFEPAVRFARVDDKNGQLFASYVPEGAIGDTEVPQISDARGSHVSRDGSLWIVADIADPDERHGRIYIRANRQGVIARFWRQVAVAFGVLLLCLAVSSALASRLQRLVSLPVMRLAAIAEQISRDRNYAVRVEKVAEDEIGTLYDAFNRMLDRIVEGESELKRSHDELEQRVVDRTSQLSEANTVLSREVADRKRAEEELRALQATHLETARRAGMAEIATGVLHNVGNVLNSVNVSAALVGDLLRQSGVPTLGRAVELIKQHEDDFGRFVSEDVRGRHLPRFFTELNNKMAGDEERLLAEITALSKNIEHIKDIVSLQQSYAGVSGVAEPILLAELLEDAIRINSASIARHKIDVIRDFDDVPAIVSEKHKLMQIVVNLISNAKYALIEQVSDARQICISLRQAGPDRVRVAVSDNGMGIPRESLTRVFAHGFTTRKDGHGFGLHSAANLANELGGSLNVASDGPGKGATFVLELALKPVPATDPALRGSMPVSN